jgi:hypothetical protein
MEGVLMTQNISLEETDSTPGGTEAPACKNAPPIDATSDALVAHAPAPQDVETKSVAWPGNYHVGDCHIYDMSLAVRSDGSATFQAYVESSDDDDVWVFYGGISLLDNHGVELWRSGKLDGPSMPFEDSDYTWTQNFFYPAQWFSAFSSAKINQMHC